MVRKYNFENDGGRIGPLQSLQPRESGYTEHIQYILGVLHFVDKASLVLVKIENAKGHASKRHSKAIAPDTPEAQTILNS